MSATLGVLLAGMCACETEQGKSAKAKALEVKKAAAEAIAAKIEAEMIDYMACQTWVDADLMKDLHTLLRDRKKLSVDDLVLTPDGVVDLVGGANDAQTVAQEIANIGKVFADQQGLFADGKPGWDVNNCSATVKIPCVKGTAKVVFSCEGGSTTSVGKGTFEACELGVIWLDGTMTLTPGKTSGVVLGFDKFGVGKKRTLTGALLLDGVAGTDGVSIAVDSAGGEAVTLEENGGHKGGFSCGRTTTLNTMALSLTDTSLQASADFSVETPDIKLSAKTVAPHLTWTLGDKCICPDSESAVAFTAPRPGGEKGETVTMNVSFAAAETGAKGCRRMQVALPDWPVKCSIGDTLINGCGETVRDATQRIGSHLATELCRKVD